MTARQWMMHAVLIGATLLSGCLLGGTGTGTGNGIGEEKPATVPDGNAEGLTLRYRDGANQPVAGLQVVFLPADYSPLDAAPAHAVNVPAESLVTDSAGKLPQFRFLAAGVYVATAMNGVGVVALDTLRVSDVRSRAVGEFMVQPPRLWQGQISLESNLKIDSGWLVVHGTPYKAAVDSLGRYKLGHLPPDLKARAAVVFERYVARPFVVSDATLLTDSKIPTADSTSVSVNQPISLPGGVKPPDTIQVVNAEFSTSITRTDSLLKVQCVPVTDSITGATQSVCLEKDTLTYRTSESKTASNDVIVSPPDTTKPVYLNNGKVLPSCTASTQVKTSDALAPTPGGTESDFTVLDVSASPTCEG